MKFVQTGWGPDGQSVIESVTEIATDSHTPLVPLLTMTNPLAAVSPDSASAAYDLKDSGVNPQPDAATWSIFRQFGGQSFGLHHTDTVDFDVVLSGSTTLSAEEGRVEMSVGDCALIPGVPHRWDAGTDGCLISVLFLGTIRQAGGDD